MMSMTSDASSNALYENIKVEDVDATTLQPWFVPEANLGPTIIVFGDLRLDGAKLLKETKPVRSRPMTDAEFQCLKESIRIAGRVEHPVIFDERGHLVDGYHRIRAFLELSLEGVRLEPLPYQFVRFRDRRDNVRLARAMNFGRRQCTGKDLIEGVKQVLLEGDDGTDEVIARKVGVKSKKTVQRVRVDLEKSGQLEFLEVRRDPRGHAQKQTRSEGGNGCKAPTKVAKSKTARPVVLVAPSPENIKRDLPKDWDDNRKSLMPVLLPLWWEKYGMDAVDVSCLVECLESARLLEKVFGKPAGCGVAVSLGRCLNGCVGASLGGVRMLNLAVKNKAAVYWLRPEDWTKHGPKTTAD